METAALGAASRRVWACLLVVIVWCWLPSALAQTHQAAHPALAHLVRLAPGTRPLGDVLAELSRQGQLPFSYSSSLVPVSRLCTLRPGPARPLGVILRELLGTAHTSYGLVGGQLVLWPDHIAPPAGVVAVNGQTTTARPLGYSRPAPSASVKSDVGVPAKAASTNAQSNSRPASASGAEGALNPTTAIRARAATDYRTSAKQPQSDPSKTLANTRRQFDKTTRSGSLASSGITTDPRAEIRKSRSTTVGKQNVTKRDPSTRSATKQFNSAASTTTPRSGRPSAQPTGQRQAVTQKSLAPSSPIAARRRGQLAARPVPVQEALATIPPRVVSPETLLSSRSALPAVLGPAGISIGQPLAASPVSRADLAAKTPRTLADRLRNGYLHGEAWAGETLPLNAAVKLGVPRLYLVLGSAADPFGRGTDYAWGVGLGTLGQTRGRFTPSLDLIQWFVTGDRESPAGRLTQLRPLLGWQLKSGGRWQLVGGPTLNLATATRERGRPFRWDLGQDQWLWLDSENPQSLLRLWPGVQLGLRF